LDDRGLGIFLFDTTSRAAVRPTQPPIQCVPGTLSLVVERPERETDHSPPSSADVKEYVELYLHSQYVFIAWCLVKHIDNLKGDDFIVWYLVRFCKTNNKCAHQVVGRNRDILVPQLPIAQRIRKLSVLKLHT
jgi:hypothetical protein